MTTARSRFCLASVLVLGSGAAFAASDNSEPQAANLSPQETLTQAKDYQSKMQDTLRDIITLQEQAKKKKDIIQLNCVNDKVTQVRGHLAVGDTAMASLNEAVAKNDQDGRQQEFTKVSILFQKVLLLGTEAKNCLGADLSYVGATTVEQTIDPTIPQRDVTAFAFPSVDTQRPPVASSAL